MNTRNGLSEMDPIQFFGTAVGPVALFTPAGNTMTTSLLKNHLKVQTKIANRLQNRDLVRLSSGDI